jgi:hypothetical protein
MIARTKAEAQQHKAIGTRVEYEKELLNTLYRFHSDIGANKELPTEKEALKSYLIRLHETLTVNNPIFGNDILFSDIYPEWLMAVVYDKATRYGNNISALARCFNDWYKMNADKYLNKPMNPVVKREGKGSVERWPDHVIKSQYQTILMLNSNSPDFGLLESKGAKSYFNSIKQEYIKRFMNESA